MSFTHEEDFFKHKNQAGPTSLSDNGKLHTSQKSQSQFGLTLPEREPEGGRGIQAKSNRNYQDAPKLEKLSAR